MLTRREFIKLGAGSFAAFMLTRGRLSAENPGRRPDTGSETFDNKYPSIPKRTVVSLVKTDSRKEGVSRAVELIKMSDFSGRKILLKPNFNSSAPFPGSTHIDTLEQLVKELRNLNAGRITIGERSGPSGTYRVMKEKGIEEFAERFDVSVVNFEELSADGWVRINGPDFYWKNGFKVARPFLEAEEVVSTCCLKTHGFGGVFTMSLKLSVGITSKTDMLELHTSTLNMRKMIAEINTCYNPSLILLDGIEAFVDGGPDRGELKQGNCILAGRDRVAIDAVGLAILKELGSNRQIMETPIFEQEQIKRAVELGLGVDRPQNIEIVTGDRASEKYAGKLKDILLNV
jgi:uncharacterized protein (DUF362 family)